MLNTLLESIEEPATSAMGYLPASPEQPAYPIWAFDDEDVDDDDFLDDEEDDDFEDDDDFDEDDEDLFDDDDDEDLLDDDE